MSSLDTRHLKTKLSRLVLLMNPRVYYTFAFEQTIKHWPDNSVPYVTVRRVRIQVLTCAYIMVRLDTPAKPRPPRLTSRTPHRTPVFRFTIIKIPFHVETSSSAHAWRFYRMSHVFTYCVYELSAVWITFGCLRLIFLFSTSRLWRPIFQKKLL